MIDLELTSPEAHAILASLRLLQRCLRAEPNHPPVEPNDGDIGDILTDMNSLTPLDDDDIEDLCEEINDAIAIA